MEEAPERAHLVADYASAIVDGMLMVSRSLASLEHGTSKGTLRELLVSTVIRRFLSSQFSISSGIVINQQRQQSGQTDIVIFDNRVLPPFIHEQNVGVIPAESVVAVIEVKSRLDAAQVVGTGEETGADEAAQRILGVCAGVTPAPLTAVFGFYKGSGLADLHDRSRGKSWLQQNVKHLDAVVLAGEFSWLRMWDEKRKEKEWRGGLPAEGSQSHEETKRFFAVLLDNCRTRAEARWRHLVTHEDWFSAYIRDQRGPLSPKSTPPPTEKDHTGEDCFDHSGGQASASSFVP